MCNYPVYQQKLDPLMDSHLVYSSLNRFRSLYLHYVWFDSFFRIKFGLNIRLIYFLRILKYAVVSFVNHRHYKLKKSKSRTLCVLLLLLMFIVITTVCYKETISYFNFIYLLDNLHLKGRVWNKGKTYLLSHCQWVPQ